MSELSMTYTQQYVEPDTRKRITTFEQQTAHLVQEWIEPAQRLKEEAETRKRLELSELRELIVRTQQRIKELEALLSQNSGDYPPPRRCDARKKTSDTQRHNIL